eukprot:5136849-Karenia_brevis.AAC.1
MFGATIREDLVDQWRTREKQEQVIGQAELFPLLVARLTLAEYLKEARVIYFLDNEAARLGAIKAYSPVWPSLKIISSLWQWDLENESVPWYARVPTEANIADNPS